jgi:CofH subfamily radical SAM domain protein
MIQDLMSKSPDELKRIIDKVALQQRISTDDGLYLLTCQHGDLVHALANFNRKQRVGEEVLYSSTLHLYPTNLCELACPLCSFYALPSNPKAWFFTPEQLLEKIHPVLSELSEVHIVGGIWKECTTEYYQKLFHLIRQTSPTLHIKALTAVECDYLAKHSHLSIENILSMLLDAGLSSLPGGGAEILVDRVREIIAPKKLSSQEFLNVHKCAHSLGIPTNMTMLFGHIETPEDIISHLDEVRKLQDISFGISSFVPLKFLPENTRLASIPCMPKDPCRIFSVARLMLDNIDNLKALWNYFGLSTAIQLLHCGANDLGSTAFEEKVSYTAGSKQEKMTESMLQQTIRSSGRIPRKTASGKAAFIDNIAMRT